MSEANKDKTNEEQSSAADDHTQSARSANGTTLKNAPIIPRRGARPA